MGRKTLDSAQVNTEALKFMSENNKETVNEIIATIAKNKIVVIGMAQNPVVKKAKKTLEANKMEYTYLEYGNYLSKWQQRLAIKLWSGWPTFPQVFIDGKLVGGSNELTKFLKE
jgi:glutaredoxin-related protein